MRILIVSWRDICHPLAGGSEVMIDHLARGLHERGHDVALLCGGPTTRHDYRVVDGGGRFSQYLRTPFSLARHFRDRDLVVDVANGMGFYNPLWWSGPSICFVHHVHFGQWREWFNPAVAWVGSTLETRVTPWAYRNSLWVTVSPSTAASLGQLGVTADQIRIVPNGVELPASGGERSDEPLFFTMGRLVPHKRFDLLLRAWKRVHPEVGGRLLVAGDGPVRPELEALASDGVELLGWVTEEEKAEYLAKAWLFLQPSRLEGWGLVVMEAAAQGTPTLGFWAPGTRDAVVHDETGVLVESENELVERWIELAHDRERRDKLGAAAYERALEFSWERSVDLFEAAAQEAVALGGRGPLGGHLPSAWASSARPVMDSERATERRPDAPGSSSATAMGDAPDLHDPRRYSKRALFSLFLDEKRDPEPFYERLAEKSIAEFPFPVGGQRILDLGSGPGHYTRVLRRFGATVAALELDTENLVSEQGSLPGAVSADAWHLPFPDASFDGVFCSNMLEHTPDVRPVFTEIARVVKPGGWAWVSWTNWYSPWGGHEIVPLHLLGPRLGLATWRRLFGEPRKNVPFDALWPTHIGPTLAAARAVPGLRVIGTYPRYYPSQRWITRAPGLREVLSWNCVIQLERETPPTEVPSGEPDPAATFDTTSARARARRALRRARRVLGDHPVFLPVVLRATPLGIERAITPDTELVIEGFPRSGNTFAFFAFRHAEPGVVVTSRVHTPSQVRLAVQRGVPTLVVVRSPADAIASLLIAAPHVPIKAALEEYIHHHEQVLALADGLVIATFDEVTDDFALVIDAINERFGTSFERFEHTSDNVDAVFAAIEDHHERHWGDTENVVPRPSDARKREKAWLLEQFRRPEYGALFLEAQTVYDALADRSISSGLGAP